MTIFCTEFFENYKCCRHIFMLLFIEYIPARRWSKYYNKIPNRKHNLYALFIYVYILYIYKKMNGNKILCYLSML